MAGRFAIAQVMQAALYYNKFGGDLLRSTVENATHDELKLLDEFAVALKWYVNDRVVKEAQSK